MKDPALARRRHQESIKALRENFYELSEFGHDAPDFVALFFALEESLDLHLDALERQGDRVGDDEMIAVPAWVVKETLWLMCRMLDDEGLLELSDVQRRRLDLERGARAPSRPRHEDLQRFKRAKALMPHLSRYRDVEWYRTALGLSLDDAIEKVAEGPPTHGFTTIRDSRDLIKRLRTTRKK